MKQLRTLCGLIVVGLSGSALATDSVFLASGDIRSAVKSMTGMSFSSSGYSVGLQHSSSDPDLYINNVLYIGGSGWNPNIDLQVNTDFYGTTNGNWGQNTYTLGTPIQDDVDWYFGGLIQRSGEINPAVPPGMYHFNIIVFGGNSSSSLNVLANLPAILEVVPSLPAVTTASTSPSSIGIFEKTDASVTFQNIGTRSLLTTTWYVSGFGLGQPYAPQDDQLILTDFLGNWFSQTIAPGASRTDFHSRWAAASTNTPGTYFGNIGIIGGLYEGDWHSWRATPDVSVQVKATRASGVISLGDFVGSLDGSPLTCEVWQGGIPVQTINTSVQMGGTFAVSPNVNGACTLKFKSRSGLKRAISITLGATPLTGLGVHMQNGDVDHSGEVDAVDIDQVIAQFGALGQNESDVDGSEEVDAVDIDIVISNFGGLDD